MGLQIGLSDCVIATQSQKWQWVLDAQTHHTREFALRDIRHWKLDPSENATQLVVKMKIVRIQDILDYEFGFGSFGFANSDKVRDT